MTNNRSLFPILVRFAAAPLMFGLVSSTNLVAQTFVQLTDLGSDLGPRLTRQVTQQRISRELFGAVGSKVSFIDFSTVYEFATDPDWARVVIGLKDQWVHGFTNVGGPGGRLSQPTGIDITAQKNVLIVDRLRGRILISYFESPTGSVASALIPRPADIAWDGRTSPVTTEYAYAVDDSLSTVSYWNLVWGGGLNSLWSYGGTGSGVGQFLHPSGVCASKTVASNGGTQFTTTFYVVDRGNHRVVRLDRASGTPAWLGEVAVPGWDPVDCSVDHFGNVYVADQSNHRIFKFTPYLYQLASYGSYGVGPNNLNTFAWPHAISVPCGLKTVNGQTVWYCEGRVITAEWWSDSSGAVEHYLGMSGSIETPIVDEPGASVYFTATDHAYVTADVRGGGLGVVKVLRDNALTPSGKTGLYWDGRLENGEYAPDGDYQFRVVMGSSYTCPSGATWCWKTVYSSFFFHRYCIPGGGDPGGGGDARLPTGAGGSPGTRRIGGIMLAQLPPPTCGEGSSGIGRELGIPAAFGIRQLPGAPVTLAEGLTALAAVADLRPSLSIAGAAVDAPADAVPLLRREVREHGVTALQVNLSEASTVRVEIFDLGGRLVWHFDASGQAPGMYVLRWSGALERGGRARPGVYSAVVHAQGRRAVSRLVLTAQDR